MQLRRAVALVLVMASGCVCGPPPGEFDSPRASLDASVDEPVTPDASVLGEDAGTDAGVVDAGSPNVPDIEVSASAFIDLGDLAYFPSANPPAAAVTRLVVRNVGRAPLFLREPAAGSAGPPSWRITPLSGGRLEQFCAGHFDEASQSCTGELRGYDVNAGLAPGDDLELPLRITPEGLGVSEFLFELFSNDPDELVTSRRLRVTTVFVPPCDVEISPNGIDFGLLGGGDSLEQAITIRNRLSQPGQVCLISNVEVSNPAVFELVDTPRMLRLEPNATLQLRVRATAPPSVRPQPMAAAAELQFSLANPSLGIQRFPLVVTFGESCLRLSPRTFDFGSTVVGCATPEKAFHLVNRCWAKPLTLIRASASSTPFLATQQFGTRDQLAPGGMLENAVRVRHRPLTNASLIGSVRVEVLQDGRPTTYVAALRGEGVVAGPMTERIPASTNKTDFVIVLDDSGSMEDKQQRLHTHLPAILEAATSSGSDFRIAVAPLIGETLLRPTSTGARWLTPATPDLSGEFHHLVTSNFPASDAFQGCVETLFRTFSNHTTSADRNRQFFRPGAALSVFCVTDAPEYWTAPTTFDLLVALKPGLRPAQLRYSVMRFISPVQGCSSGGDPNARHDGFVDRSGGTREDLCGTDLSIPMQRVGQVSFERRSSYDLTGTPDPSRPLRVYVDGTEWAPVTTGSPQITVWTFDALKNQLAFNPLAQPPAGAEIKVEYERACLQ